ncbi:MAG: hypothetical protein Fur0010_23300 [Bdellovibrio sp.]
MNDKNWLIRTHKNQILGPVSKQKIIEFLDGGALSKDDELSTGNGYWFWVRESELVERYVRGDVPQTFNPISEAKDVITSSLTENKTASISRIPSHQAKASAPNVAESLPPDDDLEFPDPVELMPSSDDLELPDMGGISVSEAVPTASISVSKKKVDEPDPKDPPGEGNNIRYPDAEDLEFPELVANPKLPAEETSRKVEKAAKSAPVPEPVLKEEEGLSLIEEDEELAIKEESFIDENEEAPIEVKPQVQPKKERPQVQQDRTQEIEAPPPKAAIHSKKKTDPKRMKKRTRVIQTPVRNDSYLKYLLIMIILCIAAVLYYYFKLLKNPIPEISSIFIQNSYAQEAQAPLKKKVL